MSDLLEIPVPQAIDAERAVLGSMMLAPNIIPTVANAVVAEQFYREQHRGLFTTLAQMAATDRAIDPVTLQAELRENGVLAKLGGAAALFELMQETPTASNWTYYAEQVRSTWRRRCAIETARRLIQAAANPSSDDSFLDIAARTSVDLDVLLDEKMSDLDIEDLHTWDEFLNRPVRPEDWIVPDLIARQDVVMVLGGEGAGKSWVSRQVAQCLTAGVHPFKPTVRIPPMRTLLVDLEVSEMTLIQEAGPMSHQVARLGDWRGDNGYVWHHPQGLDLRSRHDQLAFERRVEIAKPDLILFGSLYNAYFTGRDSHEMVADEIRVFFNRLRSRYRCALWIEHHMPKGDGVNRPSTPFGSSVWMRWVTHGRVMKYINESTYELARFRGDRGKRDLPAGLYRGGALPITAIYDEAEIDLLRKASA